MIQHTIYHYCSLHKLHTALQSPAGEEVYHIYYILGSNNNFD